MFREIYRINKKILNIKSKYEPYNSFVITIRLFNNKSILINKQLNLLPSEPKILINSGISFYNVIGGIAIIGTSIFVKYLILPGGTYCRKCYNIIHPDCKCLCHYYK